MKNLLFSAAFALLSAISAVAGVDLGFSASRTPYDGYMHPVRTVLGSLDKEGADMEMVRKLMREGRSFRYSFDRPYVAMYPNETQATKRGDCKDKALWLCDRIGSDNVRFVVGKARRSSKISHAWVLWENQGRWWILDCTNTSRPIPADSVGRNEYIPLYSWSKRGVYQHSETASFAAIAASKRRSPVASH